MSASLGGRPAFAAPSPGLPLSATLRDQFARSVRAGFGPGFRVVSAEIRGGSLHAVIENRGNRTRVISSDLVTIEVVETPSL
ncbi:hypothetical protein [Salipiger mucosus]|nr:hypothetical protein [Salipiger mucosus]